MITIEDHVTTADGCDPGVRVEGGYQSGDPIGVRSGVVVSERDDRAGRRQCPCRHRVHGARTVDGHHRHPRRVGQQVGRCLVVVSDRDDALIWRANLSGNRRKAEAKRFGAVVARDHDRDLHAVWTFGARMNMVTIHGRTSLRTGPGTARLR